MFQYESLTSKNLFFFYLRYYITYPLNGNLDEYANFRFFIAAVHVAK